MTREQRIDEMNLRLEAFMSHSYYTHRVYSRLNMSYKLAKLAINNPYKRIPEQITGRKDLYHVREAIKLLDKVGIPYEAGFDCDINKRLLSLKYSFIIVTFN